MSEQVVTAEPATDVADGTAVAETSAAETTTSQTSSEPVASSSEKAMSLDELLETVWDKHHSPPKAETAPRADVSIDQAPKAEPEPAQSSPAIGPPNSWSAESQAKWASLPPDLQTYIAGRERQAHEQISRLGAETKAYEPLREVYGWLNTVGVPQGNEHAVVRQWAQAQAYMDQNPLEALKWLAQSYNVDLSQLGGQPAPQDQSQVSAVDDLFKDPRVDQMRSSYDQKIATLEQYVKQLGGHVSAREQAEQQRLAQQRAAYEADLSRSISKFSEGKAHFQELADEVAHQVAFLKQKEPSLTVEGLLSKAYDRAMYANPQIRERVLADQRKTADAAAQKEAAAKQAQAKKLASMNVRTGASATAPTFDGNALDPEALGALYDRIQARA